MLDITQAEGRKNSLSKTTHNRMRIIKRLSPGIHAPIMLKSFSELKIRLTPPKILLLLSLHPCKPAHLKLISSLFIICIDFLKVAPTIQGQLWRDFSYWRNIAIEMTPIEVPSVKFPLKQCANTRAHLRKTESLPTICQEQVRSEYFRPKLRPAQTSYILRDIFSRQTSCVQKLINPAWRFLCVWRTETTVSYFGFLQI